MNIKNPIIICLVASAFALTGCDFKKNSDGSAKNQDPASVKSLKADAVKISDEAKAQIATALKKLDALPNDYNEFVDKNLTSEQLQSLIDDAKNVDLSKAPDDFKKAYDKSINSAEKLAKKVKDIPQAEVKDGSVLDSIKSAGEASGDTIKKWGEEIKQSFEDFKASSVELYNSAKRYITE